MFKKTEKEYTITDPTKINHDTSIEGEIFSKNDILLDGILNGKMITKKKIIIGKTGAFTGKLQCENLILEGSLEGEAKVSNSTFLMATSRFKGILSTQKFRVEEGASFEGDCKTVVIGESSEPQRNNEIIEVSISPEPEDTDQNYLDQKKNAEIEVDPVTDNDSDN